MNFKTIFSGFGGQGVLMMGYILALTAMRDGKNVTYLPAYGAEVRGGTANCTVVVSDDEIYSPVASSPDVAVVMNLPSLVRYASTVVEGGTIFINSSLVEERPNRQGIRVLPIPANKIAHDLGEDRSANVVMMGCLAEATGIISLKSLKEALAETGLGKKPAVLELNRKAVDLGAAEVRKVLSSII